MLSAPASTVEQRLSAIDLARHQVLGELRSAVGLEPLIERSWRRCLALGMEPSRPIAFDAVSGNDVQRLRQQHQPLLKAAAPAIASLSRTMADTRFFALLTDALGHVIEVAGPIDRQDRMAQQIARLGVDLSESVVGTTAIGAVLNDKSPVWLHRGEHFFDQASVFSCAGAPIWGPEGDCVGMLDLSGINRPEYPALKLLVGQAAQQIERALLLVQPHRLLLQLNWPGQALGSGNVGLLCADGDGWVCGVNQAAMALLGISGLRDPNGLQHHCSGLFATPFERLFDHARQTSAHAADYPLWNGLRLQVWPSLNDPVQASAGSNTQSHCLKDMEVAMIKQAVQTARGNVMLAAKTLGISRATVYRKLAAKKPNNNR